MAQTQDITVKGQLRQGRGKNDTRRLRREGMVPLTIYGGEGQPVSAVAPLRELAAILRSETGHNTIFTLDIDGASAAEVMFHDRQIDPIKGRLVHADLRRLVRGQKIEVTVAVVLDGDPLGVREQDGVLEQVVRELEIRVRPREIPEAIHANVENLKVHDVLHVSDVTVPEGVEILTEPETVIATVGVVKEEELAPAVEEEAPAEPEVIAKGKKEEEGGE
jgi:large subunit ribosomal protein L25